MRIIVTGAFGFIGSHLISTLNERGVEDIIAVDDLTDGHKMHYLAQARLADYLDKDAFRRLWRDRPEHFGTVDALFHQGACSSTTEWDGKYMMDNNYQYSVDVLQGCLAQKVPLFYASSAAVYGNHRVFKEDVSNEHPLNVYAYSKWLFDQKVRKLQPTSPVVGLRYFNVYGPNELHKGSMASVVHHLRRQLLNEGEARLFGSYDGIEAGQQRRDFVWVNDVVNMNLWLMSDAGFRHGVVNAGTGNAQTFEALANAVISHHGSGHLTYVPFPDHLKGHYQSYTQADMTQLRAWGYPHAPTPLETGVHATLDALSDLPASRHG